MTNYFPPLATVCYSIGKVEKFQTFRHWDDAQAFFFSKIADGCNVWLYFYDMTSQYYDLESNRVYNRSMVAIDYLACPI